MKYRDPRVALLLTVIIIGVVAALFVGGVLTARGLGIAGLFAMFVSAAIWYFIIRSSLARPAETGEGLNESANRSSEGLYIRVAVILGLLVFSAWETRGGPWLPRMIGASVLILYLLGTVVRIGR